MTAQVHCMNVYDLPAGVGRPFALVVADPWYGQIVGTHDQANVNEWIRLLQRIGVNEGVPIYWWGGIGKPGHRPFYEFLLRLERETDFRARDVITWRKKRGYGKQGDYLFVREELLVLTLGGEPYRTFHKPYTAELRGYDGYNSDYPAHSEYKRRTNIWDETELLRDKLHQCHKAPTVCRVPIEVHTDPGEAILDLFSGSGETSVQALALGRHTVAIEWSQDDAEKIRRRCNGA